MPERRVLRRLGLPARIVELAHLEIRSGISLHSRSVRLEREVREFVRAHTPAGARGVELWLDDERTEVMLSYEIGGPAAMSATV